MKYFNLNTRLFIPAALVAILVATGTLFASPKDGPDGTVFVDDVRLFSEDDGAYHQGGHKFITVMVKDSKKYASTGGWGFQAWLGGDPTKPIVEDSVKQCFTDHVPNKANDYVFST
jgi:hypothetical protein